MSNTLKLLTFASNIYKKRFCPIFKSDCKGKDCVFFNLDFNGDNKPFKQSVASVRCKTEILSSWHVRSLDSGWALDSNIHKECCEEFEKTKC